MKRSASAFLAAAAAVSMTGQALAQDAYVLPPPPPAMAQQGAFQGGYAVHAPAPAPLPASGYSAYAYDAPGYGGPAPYPYEGPVHGGYGQPGLPPVPSLGYTRDERDHWLESCRAAFDGTIQRNSGIIGSIALAAGGGVAANRLAKREGWNRLGSTLIGVGVGGLVGLALGALIGGAFQKKKKDECERYLERHEGAGYLPGPPANFQYGWQQNGAFSYGYQGYGYHTVMVPVQVGGGYTYSAPIRTENRYVIEDVVEEVVTVPSARRVIHQAPAPRTKYVPDKRVRYAK